MISVGPKVHKGFLSIDIFFISCIFKVDNLHLSDRGTVMPSPLVSFAVPLSICVCVCACVRVCVLDL